MLYFYYEQIPIHAYYFSICSICLYSCIISFKSDLIRKFKLFNYDLEKYSQDTVKQFFYDAKKSKFKI